METTNRLRKFRAVYALVIAGEVVALGVMVPARLVLAQTDPSIQVLGSVQLPVGQSVREIVVDPTTNRVYVAGSFAEHGLTVVDARDPAHPTIITTVNSGGGVTVNPFTHRFYTSDGYGGSILVYDATSNTLVDSKHVGYCGGDFDADILANHIFMISQCGAFNDPVHVLNGAYDAIIAGPLGSGGVASHVLENPGTGYIYASNWRFDGGHPFTRVFNASSTVVADYVGHTRAIDPITNRVYVEVPGSTTVSVLDGANHTNIAYIPGAGVGGASTRFGINTGLDRMYIPDPVHGNVKIADLDTNTITGTFTLGDGITPSGSGAIAVDPLQDFIYITGTDTSGTNSLYVLKDAFSSQDDNSGDNAGDGEQ